MSRLIAESTRYPYLRIRIQIGVWITEIEALIDTGFDGAVIVPDGTIPPNRFESNAIPWRFADGSEVSTTSYVGDMHIGAIILPRISINVLGQEALIGRVVIDRFRVTLDHGQRVIVEA